MISEKLHQAINEQINAEMWSAYLYLSMSMNAESMGHKGVANWFYIQYREELDHARIFMNYLNARDCKVELKAIAEVPTTWDTVLDMFVQTLAHERKVTAMINNLAAIAHDDRDFASSNRFIWFINEQVEEEETARTMIDAFKAVETNKYGMYMLDKELEARTYTTPAPLAAGE
ncbi:MAG: ferritin [Prevotella sp.]|nr:ferritin [Prevotella sp.]MCM1074936.1 ferritin [Ruminococcus sp.]